MKRTVVLLGAPVERVGWQRALRGVAGAVLSPVCAAVGAMRGVPGLDAYRTSVTLGIRALTHRGRRTPTGAAYSLMFWPMDSTRYAEFGFFSTTLKGVRPERILDVSSPRLLPAMILRAWPECRAVLLNPDASDLSRTEDLLRDAGLLSRTEVHARRIDQMTGLAGQFDVVTCMSVLEHIADDREAIGRMWDALRPGGRLLVTVPCKAEPEEQYTELNEYGVLRPGTDGLVFRQRLYSAAQLEERLFSVAGRPSRMMVWGERNPGYILRDTMQKRTSAAYAFWAEPLRFAREFARFPTIEELPGEGVVGLEFVKPR